jgi:hypothetical protein
VLKAAMAGHTRRASAIVMVLTTTRQIAPPVA